MCNVMVTGELSYPSGNTKYTLYPDNWNDFGYYTLWRLSVSRGDEFVCTTQIAIFKDNQGTGRDNRPEMDVFKDDVHLFLWEISAKKLFMFLTPAERQDLIKNLKIEFDGSPYSYQNIFKTSLLRNSDLSSFNKKQHFIKTIMLSEVDVTNLFNSPSDNKLGMDENIYFLKNVVEVIDKIPFDINEVFSSHQIFNRSAL